MYKGPSNASLGHTILVRLPLAKEKLLFTCRLFFAITSGVAWPHLETSGSSSCREGNYQLLSCFVRSHLRRCTCAFSFNLLNNPLWGVLLSSFYRWGNSCSEKLGNMPHIRRLNEDRSDTQTRIFLSLKRSFSKMCCGAPGQPMHSGSREGGCSFWAIMGRRESLKDRGKNKQQKALQAESLSAHRVALTCWSGPVSAVLYERAALGSRGAEWIEFVLKKR